MARIYFDEANNNLTMSTKLNSTSSFTPSATTKASYTMPSTTAPKKTEFTYCGKHEKYDVTWFNDTSNGEKPKMRGTLQEFIVVLEDVRINCYFVNPMDVLEYAKTKIATHGRGTATGNAYIYWITESGREIAACKIVKTSKMLWKPKND